jgi:hypothetical protein
LKKDEEEEESEEEEEVDSDGSSSSCEVAVAKVDARSKLKQGNAELDALKRDQAALQVRIEAARRKKATKLSELSTTLNNYPAQVCTLILYVWILSLLFTLIYGLCRRSTRQRRNLLYFARNFSTPCCTITRNSCRWPVPADVPSPRASNAR